MLRTIFNRPFTGQRKRSQPSRKLSLPWMLTVPFILQLGTAVSLVGYLSYRNGQHSVEDLTNQLMNSVGNRVEQKLTSYLSVPWLVNQSNSDAVVRGALDLNLDRSNPQREQYLWQQMQLFPNLAWISLASEQGDSLGIWRPENSEKLQFSMSNRSTQYFGTYYATNNQGIHTTQLKVEKPAFDPRTRPWYKAAINAKQGIWTSIYSGFTPGTVFIAASQPMYDRSGKLLGVSGIDVSLLGIQKFLAQTPVSQTGQVFLVDQSGMLVASSSEESPFRTIVGKEPERRSVINSETPLIRSTARFIDQKLGGFQTIQQAQNFQFDNAGQHYFGRVVSFSHERGLNWSIVVVVPAADVMTRINANNNLTIWLCLIASIAVILLNTFIARWLAKPIMELSQASQDIAQGNFSYKPQPSHPNVHEISNLAVSFGQMSREIQSSRSQLEEYSRSLEQQVIKRTQDLQAEIERRYAAEAALQRVNKELAEIAYVDGLTKIANRRQFDDRLLQEWRRLQREQKPLSLIICDVDFFKQYNDTYGHSGGDECLCLVAKAIEASARRAADLAARYGGEEFVALLPNTPLVGAMEVAKSIQARVKDLQIRHQKSTVSEYLTLSIGVSGIIPSEVTTPEELLIYADQALYQAKQAGRNQIVLSQMNSII
jgi:diguanylate cyclase (GGDEF)-like protein